jgi:hypothetical protein
MNWNILHKERHNAIKRKSYNKHKQSIFDKQIKNIKYIRHLHGDRCERCGVTEPLEFHHINPSNKLFNLGISNGTRSLESLIAESNKCQLLCSNCHRLQ